MRMIVLVFFNQFFFRFLHTFTDDAHHLHDQTEKIKLHSGSAFGKSTDTQALIVFAGNVLAVDLLSSRRMRMENCLNKLSELEVKISDNLFNSSWRTQRLLDGKIVSNTSYELSESFWER